MEPLTERRDATYDFNESELDRIIEMAWEDRTPFSAIEFQFGLPEGEVIKVMRKTLKRSSFNRWRKRVNSGVSIKHEAKRPNGIITFKSTRQKQITGNKISKR
ncbi:TIGR03643 family protein [Patiriisocius marinistellae]|uniref:TIGR03643 family protein n=1 Tax=Patiriisocius marinistellae TaxID=2494560 RepID=A0A5J4G1C8_9FLAO|nr:TIGR03643 family protein [Patiriisocius marinistellae]GEQ86419.1 TIGR03643 family protein [Patiriisocius marinistellae]